MVCSYIYIHTHCFFGHLQERILMLIACFFFSLGLFVFFGGGGGREGGGGSCSFGCSIWGS